MGGSSAGSLISLAAPAERNSSAPRKPHSTPTESMPAERAVRMSMEVSPT